MKNELKRAIGVTGCAALAMFTFGACGDSERPNSGAAVATSGSTQTVATVAEPPAVGDAAVVDTGGNGVDLVSDGRTLWVLTCERACAADAGGTSGEILRVDPERGAVVKSAEVPSPHTLAVGPSDLVALDFRHSVVRGYDPTSLSQRRQIGLQLPFAVARDDRAFLPLSASVSDDAVWVVSGRGVVARLDPALDEVAATIRLGGKQTGAVLASDDGAWIADGTRGLEHVDAATGDVSTLTLSSDDHRLAVNNVIDAGDAVIATGASISNGVLTGKNAYAMVDKRGQRVIARGPLPAGRVAATFADGSLWAGRVGSRSLMQITASSAQVETHRLQHKLGWPLTFANGHLWTLSGSTLRELDAP